MALDDLRKKWTYVYGRMTGTFKRDKKFVERIMKFLDYNPNLIDPIINKIKKLDEQFKGDEFARILRWILKEDFDLQ